VRILPRSRGGEDGTAGRFVQAPDRHFGSRRIGAGTRVAADQRA
jgi:hypothetical protein